MFVTTNSITWENKTFKAKPEPSCGNSCTGCAFRSFDGECSRPVELQLYTCLSTLRSDYKGVIWREEDKETRAEIARLEK